MQFFMPAKASLFNETLFGEINFQASYAKLLFEFSFCGFLKRFVGIHKSTREIPISLHGLVLAPG